MFNVNQLDKIAQNTILTKSRSTFDLLLAAEQWDSIHGKMYVPITDEMSDCMRFHYEQNEILSNFGDSLMMINSSLIIHKLGKIYNTPENKFHFATLDPVCPDNRPDEWEMKALKTFIKAGDEYSEIVKENGKAYYRYMAPLIAKESGCENHKYKAGDIYGGISIYAVYDKDEILKGCSSQMIVRVYIFIFIAGFLFLLYFRKLAIKYYLNIESKNKQLTKASEDKDSFYNIIAYDLKSPAYNIVSLLNILDDKDSKLSDEDKDRCATLLRDSAKANLDLLTNLLEWSRLQTNHTKFNPEKLDLKKIINRVYEGVFPQAQYKEIEIIDKSQEHYAIADKNMITTVLRNLLVNAIKFTPKGGNITINTSLSGNFIKISIKDTGVGMSKYVIESLLKINQRISTPGTENEQGTGLGLILCKEFVEKNKGKITIESELEKGSIFHFTIPVDKTVSKEK